jgi:hypothetical protein
MRVCKADGETLSRLQRVIDVGNGLIASEGTNGDSKDLPLPPAEYSFVFLQIATRHGLDRLCNIVGRVVDLDQLSTGQGRGDHSLLGVSRKHTRKPA